MKLSEIKAEVQKYQYLEDTGIIDAALASIIANRLMIGDPIWLLIIGASSGGKSQILRPLSLTDARFMHRVDDLTENTFLSGMKAKAGEEPSLLLRIGTHATMVISDFTVIMSKSAEARASILSQLRMVYDGEMVKHSGSTAKPIQWKGHLGILAGSTPSIYRHFEEVADMGERFVYYRMKEFDQRKATELALSRKMFGRELDERLSSLYGDYVRGVVGQFKGQGPEIAISQDMSDRIIEVSMFAEKVRTTSHKDWKGNMDKIPVSAMPMRVALQLTAIARGLGAIRMFESEAKDSSPQFEDSDYSIIDWIGYSLANEENRAVLRALARVAFDATLNTTTIADIIGLDTTITRMILQNLSAVGVLLRAGDDNSLAWSFKKMEDYSIVRRIERIGGVEVIESRATSAEDHYQVEAEQQMAFESFGN